ncbi:MAG: hypothetical protein ACRYFS_11245 [Janthinobacterium lividum]
MTYYPYWYRLDSADAYLLWYTDVSPDGVDPDGVVLDEAGFILTFRHVDDLRQEAARRGLPVEPRVDPEPLDLDAIALWLATARKTNVDCETFLNAWNLFSDLASTIQGGPAHIDGQREGQIYHKLFWGNNLPVVTPPGKHYDPLWSKSDVGKMRNVLGVGMRLFRDRLGPDVASGQGWLEVR